MARTKELETPFEVEAVKATAEQAKTFMQGIQRETGPDYHVMLRIVGEHYNPNMGVFTADMVDSAVNNWLERGYRLHSVHSLGPVEIPGQPLAGFRFAWHFVAE